MIARGPSLPNQVKAHLKARIVSGEFEEGRIPSEQELATDLGVSRTTIRDALSRLEHEGAIYRIQGAGTFVNEPGLQIKSRLEEIWSYEGVLRDHGYTPSVRVLGVDHERADEAVANDLAIDPGDSILVMHKLFLEDDDPVVLTGEPAEVLGAAEGTPALCFEEIGFDQDNTPIVRSTSYFRDDLLRFRLIRRRAGA